MLVGGRQSVAVFAGRSGYTTENRVSSKYGSGYLSASHVAYIIQVMFASQVLLRMTCLAGLQFRGRTGNNEA